MIEFELDQKYDKSRFMAFLKTFLPDDYVQQEKELSINFKPNYITKAKSLGTCKSVGLEVLEINHSSLNDARVGLSKDGFRLLLDQSYYNHALVVFLPEEGGQWRLSLIQMEAEMNEHSSRIQHSYSNPRRYSFLLGEGAHVKTPHQFLFEKGPIRERKENNKDLSKWDDLLSRFSVETLTKEFYNKLYHWYQWAVEESTGVYFPNKPETAKDDRDAISANIIRLVTRLLFVWFIKQKDLVPNKIFDTTELDKILVDFDAQAKDSSVYYNAILQNLFFATLNNEIDKRAFIKPDFQGRCQSHGVKTLYRDDRKSTWFKVSHDEFVKLFHQVPYMNCGLFECQDKYEKTDIGQLQDLLLDGFSSKGTIDRETGHFKYRAFIPNYLFFAPEHKETVTIIEDKKIKQETVNAQGLITLFEEYNFTIEENTPVDVQVSLDPELLGRVFENLLAAYNPETGESARKSTGSFYTPREIVEYMVNESLIEFLKTNVPEGESLENQFRKLVNYLDNEIELTDEQKDACLKALYDCKILDPACGSGAFPMGMLQQMVHIIKQLDPDNKKWRQVVLNKALEESKKAFLATSKVARQEKRQEAEDEFDDDMTNPDYKRKLYIIQNCIYGVDIQPIAMLISKLRFFISLVCEQDKIDFEHPEDNYGINTLPNLETKFVSANTLLSPDINNFTGDWTVDENLKKLKDDLIDIRMRHFRVKTQRSKQDNREKDEAKRKEILDYIINTTSKPNDELIVNRKELIKQYFDELVQYREKKLEEVETPTDLFGGTKIVTIDVNAAKRKELQDRIKSCEEEIRREENKKNPAGFEAAVKQVTEWNPYDQNSSSPFFSPEWMFGVNNGFDIVIGNPPYGVSIKGQYRNDVVRCLGNVPDFEIYYYFIQIAHNLLIEQGILSLIIPNTYLFNSFAKNYRLYLLDKWNILEILDCTKFKIFESATVLNTINTWQKNEGGSRVVGYRKTAEAYSFSSLISRPRLLIQKDSLLKMNQNWGLAFCLSDVVVSIINKISSQPHCISDFYNCSQGYIPYRLSDLIVTYGKEEGSRIKNQRLWHSQKKTKEYYIQEIYGRDITKYNYSATGEYIKYGKHVACYVDPVFFTSPRLLVREITNPTIIACYIEEPFLNDPQLIPIITKNGRKDNLYYLWAILNSRLATFYHFNHSPKATKGAFPKILVQDIKQFPLPPITDNIQKTIKDIVAKIMSDKEKDLDTSALESEIDKLVYKLYGLTEEEIKIVEGTN